MISLVKKGDTVHLDVCIHNPETGALSNASSISYLVYEGSTDTPVASGTPTTRATGHYKFSFDTTGFTLGSYFNVVVSATVSSLATKTRVATFKLVENDALTLSDVVDSDNSLDLQAVLQIMLATLAGRTQVTDNDIAFKDVGGNSTVVIVTVGENSGERINVILPS